MRRHPMKMSTIRPLPPPPPLAVMLTPGWSEAQQHMKK
jgi:hypothetical protein